MAGAGIEARGLVKQFGRRRALDGVDLSVPAGAFLSIFGPNGAGKTTLLRALALLSRPTRGELTMLGVDALEHPGELRARIGLISHRPMLYGDLTAAENLEFFSSLYAPEPDRARIRELLRLVELDHRRTDAVRTFSRGMQQRLAIARALVTDPEIVLLDEPYSGLDPHAVELMDGLIARVRDGRTFVMVSHDLEKGFDMCTHALVMALLVLTVYGAALMQVGDTVQVVSFAGGLLWALIVFTSLLGLNRSFNHETETGCLEGILLAPVDRAVIFLAKAASNLIFLLAVEVVAVPLFSLFFLSGAELATSTPLIAVPLLVGTVGVAGVGTLLATMTQDTRGRDVLLAILFIPVVFPLLYACVSATGIAFLGVEGTFGAFWTAVAVAVAYDVIMVAAAWGLYEFAVEG